MTDFEFAIKENVTISDAAFQHAVQINKNSRKKSKVHGKAGEMKGKMGKVASNTIDWSPTRTQKMAAHPKAPCRHKREEKNRKCTCALIRLLKLPMEHTPIW